MSSRPHITLFDVSCTLDPPAWSPNVWRTRFVLNYKNLPYETQWVHYPDIKNTLRAVNAPPSRPEPPLYTVPAIVDRRPDGTSEAVSDSLLILDYLEQHYPSPSLFPGDTRAAQEEIINALMQHVVMKAAFMVMSTTVNILDERDAEYFTSSRKRIFGVGVENMFPDHEEGREQVYQSLKEGFDKLAAIIDEKGVGGKAWIFSDDPTYADFCLVAHFIWLNKAGPKGAWNRVKKWNDGKWESLYLSAEKYMRIF